MSVRYGNQQLNDIRVVILLGKIEGRKTLPAARGSRRFVPPL